MTEEDLRKLISNHKANGRSMIDFAPLPFGLSKEDSARLVAKGMDFVDYFVESVIWAVFYKENNERSKI